MRSSPSPSSYANARHLVAEALQAFLPPDAINVAEYAAENRWLSNEGGGYVGRWSHAEAPYLVTPMELLTGSDHLTVAIVGPGQSGKTAVAENWFLRSVGVEPADMLWYMQTDPGVEAYVKGRINPMIDGHDILNRAQGLRPVDDSLHFKRFRGMKVEFLAAVLSNLINKSAPRIVADEIDAYADSIGDVMPLLNIRRQTFGRESKILALSHPDKAGGLDPSRHWTAGIMAIYADSDRRTWWWPCPHCGAWSSPNPTTSRVMVLDWPADGTLDEIQAETRLVCPVNGCLIEDHHRRGMNAHGRWIGLGQEIDEEGTVSGEMIRRDTAGLWIMGVMSPFILGGIGGLARALVKAERDLETTGDEATLRQVVVKQLGQPYTPRRSVGNLDANTLADRAEDLQLGTVPEGGRFLTAAVDVQNNRFEALIRAWGVRGESWIVDRIVHPSDPSISPNDWDDVLNGLLDRQCPLADGSGRVMRIRAVGYDTGGAPGVTQQAYDAWRRFRARRQAKLMGMIDGRHAWTLIPLKGLGGINASRLSVVYPDTARKDRRVSAGGQVPIGQFNANAFKDDLAGQLSRAEPGPWMVHLPNALKAKEPPHPFFEQLVAERRKPNGAWEKTTARNEALDLMVMTHVVAHLHGLARVNWERPPPWASEWDKNPLVGQPTEPTNAPPQSLTPAAPPPASAGAAISRFSRMA